VLIAGQVDIIADTSLTRENTVTNGKHNDSNRKSMYEHNASGDMYVLTTLQRFEHFGESDF
jgi:hypothetical protein